MRPLLVLPLLVAASLLSACTQAPESQPQSLPTVTAPPTLTPTPTSAVRRATLPKAAMTNDYKGAAAFTRFYFGEVNKAYLTPDKVTISHLSEPGCKTCNKYVRALEEMKTQGRHLRYPDFRIVSAEAASPVNGVTQVLVQSASPAQQLVDRKGAVLEAYPARSRVVFAVGVRYHESSWLISEIERA